MNEVNRNAAIRLVEIKKRNPVILIGAGLSIPPYWHWLKLMTKISEFMEVDPSTNTNPILAAQELYNHNPAGFYRSVCRIFSDSPSFCRPAMTHIVNIGFKSILTTNFDRTIEIAYILAGKEIPKFMVYPRLMPALCTAGTIHYLHGRVHQNVELQPNIIFNQESYNRSYFGESREIPSFLFQVLLMNNVIFTGYSLAPSEPINHVIRALVEFAKNKESRELAESFEPRTKTILLPEDGVHGDAAERLATLGIEILLYDRLDESYGGLDEVWQDVRMRTLEAPALASNPFDPLSGMPAQI